MAYLPARPERNDVERLSMSSVDMQYAKIMWLDLAELIWLPSRYFIGEKSVGLRNLLL